MCAPYPGCVRPSRFQLDPDAMSAFNVGGMAGTGTGELLTVGAVARLAGVTVRTLHHYDEIGLVSPSGRSPAGYRLYDAADLDRLQAVLAYRALGFGPA